LRISEASNLRLEDCDRSAQKLFVRLPNKTDRERYVPFHDKTRRYLAEWLNKRPACMHDHLFCNELGGPMTKQAMSHMLNSVLRKDYRTHHHDTGLKVFSFHRLRHRFGSLLGNRGVDAAVIMAIGGWSSFEAMQKYVQILPETINREYSNAMQQKEEKESPVETISLSDFTKRCKASY
jgi:site-specific recombinase XerD